MGTKLNWTRTGLALVCETSARAVPKTVAAPTLVPDFSVVGSALISLALEDVPGVSRRAIRVVTLDAAGLPNGGPWTLWHREGAGGAWEAISLGAVDSVSYLFTDPTPSVAHYFRLESGGVTYPAATITTPADKLPVTRYITPTTPTSCSITNPAIEGITPRPMDLGEIVDSLPGGNGGSSTPRILQVVWVHSEVYTAEQTGFQVVVCYQGDATAAQTDPTKRLHDVTLGASVRSTYYTAPLKVPASSLVAMVRSVYASGQTSAWTSSSAQAIDAPVVDAVAPAWSNITGKPSTFAPSTHSHATSDVTGLDSALSAKAPLASPAFTGTPTAPTVATADNSTKIATTEWVRNQGFALPTGGSATWGNIIGTLSAQGDLQTALNGKVGTSDSRLTDARPASDVYAWAKAATKPAYTAAEVGALGATAQATDSAAIGGVQASRVLAGNRTASDRLYPSDGTSADTFGSGQTFSYASGSPWTGPLLSFGGLGGALYDCQLNADYGSGVHLSFRTRNGDTATWNTWRELIHSGNISLQSVYDSARLGGQLPTYYQTALGYTPINKAGDSGIGNLSMGALTATTVTLNGGGDIYSLRAGGVGGTAFVAIGNSGGTPTIQAYTAGFADWATLSIQPSGSPTAFGGPLTATSGSFSAGLSVYSPSSYYPARFYKDGGAVSLYTYSDAGGAGIANANPFSSGALFYLNGQKASLYGGGVERITLDGSNGALTASGVADIAGQLYLGGFSGPSKGSIWKQASYGLAIAGTTGAAYDLALLTPAAALVMTVPTGTNSTTLHGVTNILGGSSLGLTFRSNGITTEEYSGPDAININYTGYQNGTTQFRDFKVWDGKQGQIMGLDGATKAATFKGATLTVTNTAGAFLQIGTAENNGSNASPLSHGINFLGASNYLTAQITSEDRLYNEWGTTLRFFTRRNDVPNALQQHLVLAGNDKSTRAQGEVYALNDKLVLHLGNVGSNAATFQAAVASATAPLVGTVAQRNAYTPAAGTTPYWYSTDETAPDGQLGTLRQWTGSGWGEPANPAVVAGRVTAGVISAGAIGTQALASDLVLGTVIRTSNASWGTGSYTAILQAGVLMKAASSGAGLFIGPGGAKVSKSDGHADIALDYATIDLSNGLANRGGRRIYKGESTGRPNTSCVQLKCEHSFTTATAQHVRWLIYVQPSSSGPASDNLHGLVRLEMEFYVDGNSTPTHTEYVPLHEPVEWDDTWNTANNAIFVTHSMFHTASQEVSNSDWHWVRARLVGKLGFGNWKWFDRAARGDFRTPQDIAWSGAPSAGGGSTDKTIDRY